MRDILFRGKRTDNGEWVYGLLCRVGDTYANIRRMDTAVLYSVLTNTIGQFTGLTDKNGRKIFEGDILQGFWYCEGVRAKVVWIDDAATFGILYSFRKSGEKTAWLNSSWYKFTSESPCFPEIIGNIYDNPELLEETE